MLYFVVSSAHPSLRLGCRKQRSVHSHVLEECDIWLLHSIPVNLVPMFIDRRQSVR